MGRGLADQVRFVGHLHVQRILVDRGVNGDGLYSEFVASANDPTSDLATVGNQYLGKHNLILVNTIYPSYQGTVALFVVVKPRAPLKM